MSLHDPLVYADHAKGACRAIIDFVAGIDPAEYAQNLQLRSAVERQMTILSEALAKLLRAAPDAATGWATDPRQVIAFRNHIVHAYDVLNDEDVLRIAQQDVPVLLGDLERTLGPSTPRG